MRDRKPCWHGGSLASVMAWKDSLSIECHNGAMIPDEVLAEMLRRKGWTVTRG